VPLRQSRVRRGALRTRPGADTDPSIQARP
jgi:hypothetical protein